MQLLMLRLVRHLTLQMIRDDYTTRGVRRLILGIRRLEVVPSADIAWEADENRTRSCPNGC